jgi:hypothetical protein
MTVKSSLSDDTESNWMDEGENVTKPDDNRHKSNGRFLLHSMMVLWRKAPFLSPVPRKKSKPSELMARRVLDLCFQFTRLGRGFFCHVAGNDLGFPQARADGGKFSNIHKHYLSETESWVMFW